MHNQSQDDTARRLRVFLCHSSHDKPRVRELYHQLRVQGIDPWLDELELLAGQVWEDEIRKAIRDTNVVIICLSQESISKTGFVHKEIKFALDIADKQPEGTIFLIPLKLEECELPQRLSQLQCVNLFEEKGFENLLRALQKRATDLGITLRKKRSGNVRKVLEQISLPTEEAVPENQALLSTNFVLQSKLSAVLPSKMTSHSLTILKQGLSRVPLILQVVVVLFFIAGSISVFYIVMTNHINTVSIQATATAQASPTQYAETVTAFNAFLANSNATANASSAIATATYSAATSYPPINSYPPKNAILRLDDPLKDNGEYSWNIYKDSTSSCLFSGGYYYASIKGGYYFPCTASNTDFYNFVYEVQMKIIKGDCGGLIFRADITTSNFYLFRVCQDGTVAFYTYGSNMAYTAGTLLSPHFESAMNVGLNQTNLIAVVARGYLIDLFVNHQKIGSIIDSSYSNGQIGVDADGTPGKDPTEVVYSNAKVWAL